METKNNKTKIKKKCYLVSSTKDGLKTIAQVKARDQRKSYLRDKKNDKIKMLKDHIKKLESKIYDLRNNQKTLSSFGNYHFMEKIGADAVSTRLKNKDDEFGTYFIVYRINGVWYKVNYPDIENDHSKYELEKFED